MRLVSSVSRVRGVPPRSKYLSLNTGVKISRTLTVSSFKTCACVLTRGEVPSVTEVNSFGIQRWVVDSKRLSLLEGRSG